MSGRGTRRKPYFFLQFHITPACNLKCEHCYIRDREDYHELLENKLPKEDIKKVVDDLVETTSRWGIESEIHWSGGQVWYREDFTDLIKYGNKAGVDGQRVMVNGTQITPERAKKLYELRAYPVQVSIDGVKEMHDKFRGAEDNDYGFSPYEEAMKGIRTLAIKGCSPTVSTTLSKQNLPDLEEIVNNVSKSGADRMGTSRLVPVGAGKNISKDLLSKEELKNAYLRLIKATRKRKFDLVRHGPLWNIISNLENKGRLVELGQKLEKPFSGCAWGYTGLSILDDGTVVPCRRAPIPIGKVPEQKISDIYVESDVLKEVRNYEAIEGCGDCELKYACRGCRAVAWAEEGDYMAKDPQCFKDLISSDDIKEVMKNGR